MELNDSHLPLLSDYLEKTLNPDIKVRKPSEVFLQSLEKDRGYPLLLLTLLNPESSTAINIKVAAAVSFKNFVKRNWKVMEEVDMIHSADRDAIKLGIVDLMLKSPPSIQKQLSAAIAIIGKEDFPAKWPNLINDMVTKFATGDYNVINGVLQTAASIFEKYTFEMKSQKLWEEIKFVLDNFCDPFTRLFSATMGLANEHAGNQVALKVIYGSLVQISRIFYYLNYQDLPEFFEDNISVWMTHFLQLLETTNPLLSSSDNEEPGVLEELKSQICDNIGLYAHKYEEEFSPFMQKFVTSVWNLLLTTGSEVKYDMLTSNAIQFLASVADRQQYKSLFEDPNTLASICEKIIVPNIQLRECDIELFEDNPEEYIRIDLEGSDVDTRRRAACDLVRGLSRYFEPQITSIFGNYIERMLVKYHENPANCWMSKDAAIYLVTSLATRAKTAKHGITQTNQLVDLGEFCRNHILKDLSSEEINLCPILKSAAVKYVLTFRSQLPQDLVKSCVPHLIRFLRASSHVTHTYAAAAIEKILLMRVAAGSNSPALVTGVDLSPVAEPLLQGLFGAFELQSSAENEYVMKCIMRSFSTLQETVVPFLSSLLPVLTQKLQLAAKNPSKPHYNHYLFESLSLSIRIVCQSRRGAIGNFEAVLFPVFQEILQQDVQEFVPYVFQILSLLLEYHEQGDVPQPYLELFQFLLVPVLWERHGNIHALVRLLQAYISRGPQQVVASQKLEPMLGVFQKLIASKLNDHEGFNLIQSLVEFLPSEVMVNYNKPIYTLLFQRLTSSKTTKFVKSFITFMCLYATKFGGQSLIEICDSIQPNLFAMVVERLFILEAQKVSGSVDRKICTVGFTKLLCETPALFNGAYSRFWLPMLQAVVGVFELPEDDTVEDEHFVEIDEAQGYQASYSQLIFAGKRDHDPVASITEDPRIFLAQSLHRLSGANPGVVAPLVGQLDPLVQEHLKKYLLHANVNI